MKKLLTVLFVTLLSFSLFAQTKYYHDYTPEELAKGTNLYPYQDYSNVDHAELLKKYEGLRFTDVVDAMQAIGLQDIGVMDHSIRPLWRDYTDKLSHRFCGVAVTYRYFPTNKPQPGKKPEDEFKKWHGSWYRNYAPELFTKILKPGHVIVIDAQGVENTGYIGSNNGLRWKLLGARGVVTNGVVRDTDELILQKVAVYSKYQGGGTRPGRIEAGTINQPVVVGGVMVRAGDVLVADGDGVVVVPREHAEKVSELAWGVALGDKKGRKKLYEQMNMEEDATVK